MTAPGLDEFLSIVCPILTRSRSCICQSTVKLPERLGVKAGVGPPDSLMNLKDLIARVCTHRADLDSEDSPLRMVSIFVENIQLSVCPGPRAVDFSQERDHVATLLEPLLESGPKPRAGNQLFFVNPDAQATATKPLDHPTRKRAVIMSIAQEYVECIISHGLSTFDGIDGLWPTVTRRSGTQRSISVSGPSTKPKGRSAEARLSHPL